MPVSKKKKLALPASAGGKKAAGRAQVIGLDEVDSDEDDEDEDDSEEESDEEEGDINGLLDMVCIN